VKDSIFRKQAKKQRLQCRRIARSKPFDLNFQLSETPGNGAASLPLIFCFFFIKPAPLKSGEKRKAREITSNLS
jgi:hypothetical protein